MLRQGIQRVAQWAPGTLRALWARLPSPARARLGSLVHPIALEPRGSGIQLDVPAGEPRRFDLVIAPDADGALHRVALEFGASGQRVFRLDRASKLEELARAHEIFDGVVLGAEPKSGLDVEARRLGLRPVAGGDRKAVIAAFPAVSIVVVAFAGRTLLEQCLAALARNTGWPRLEIIVIDNGTSDGTSVWLDGRRGQPALAEDARWVVIQNPENVGFARAANQGIGRASGDYVVLLNDDTVPAPGWLSRLTAHLERDPALGLVCPVTNHIGNAARIATDYATLGGMEQLAKARAFAFAGQLLGLQTVALFCAAMRRQLLEEIGLLDERFEVGMFEDDDLSRTLRERGMKAGAALDAFVHHVGQASFGRMSAARYLAIWEANRRRFEAKWGVRWMPPQA